MLSPQRLEYHYPAVVVCQQAPQATRTRFCKQTRMTSHSDVSRTKPQRWIIIVIAVCNNASWWFTLYLLGLHLKLWASLSFSLAGHITRIMFGLKMIILFIRLSCLWNFVTLWDLKKKKKSFSFPSLLQQQHLRPKSFAQGVCECWGRDIFARQTICQTKGTMSLI